MFVLISLVLILVVIWIRSWVHSDSLLVIDSSMHRVNSVWGSVHAQDGVVRFDRTGGILAYRVDPGLHWICRAAVKFRTSETMDSMDCFIIRMYDSWTGPDWSDRGRISLYMYSPMPQRKNAMTSRQGLRHQVQVTVGSDMHQMTIAETEDWHEIEMILQQNTLLVCVDDQSIMVPIADPTQLRGPYVCVGGLSRQASTSYDLKKLELRVK